MSEPVNKPYVVSATIHGPSGWYDVTNASNGCTVAVCPYLKDAKRIAALLTDHAGCSVPLAKLGGR